MEPKGDPNSLQDLRLLGLVASIDPDRDGVKDRAAYLAGGQNQLATNWMLIWNLAHSFFLFFHVFSVVFELVLLEVFF